VVLLPVRRSSRRSWRLHGDLRAACVIWRCYRPREVRLLLANLGGTPRLCRDDVPGSYSDPVCNPRSTSSAS